MALTDIFTFNFNNAVEQTRQIPVTAVPVGTTVLQAGISRPTLDPAIVLTWSIDVSRDGGATWLPWGAAGTTGEPTTGTESTFMLFLAAPADAQTRLRGTLTNTGARMTTTITIRGDTTPLPQQAPTAPHHSVLQDAFANVHGVNVTTLTTASFVITTAPNRIAVIGFLAFPNTSTGFTSTCGGVAGALVTGASSGTTIDVQSLIHAVTAPGTGTQTASMSWTTITTPSIGVMTASGVRQTTPTTGGTFSTGTSTTPSVTVATAVGDMTFAGVMTATSVSAPTQVNLALDTGGTGGGWSRGRQTLTSDAHGWTQASGTWAVAGVNLVAEPPSYSVSFADFPKEKLRQPDEVTL
jgi:hypothetical protein